MTFFNEISKEKLTAKNKYKIGKHILDTLSVDLINLLAPIFWKAQIKQTVISGVKLDDILQ